jgi:hypothetical protein
MFWQKKRQVPWDEVGTELGKRLISDAENQTQQIKNTFADAKEGDVPDFDSSAWKYELCIWLSFWVWYVANLPKLVNAGATKPLLDAYHESSLETMQRAGLLRSSLEDLREWEARSEERFLAYKKAFENPPSGPILFTGTVGWIFAQALSPEHPLIAIFMNEHGSIQFQSLMQYVQSLETKYK